MLIGSVVFSLMGIKNSPISLRIFDGFSHTALLTLPDLDLMFFPLLNEALQNEGSFFPNMVACISLTAFSLNGA